MVIIHAEETNQQENTMSPEANIQMWDQHKTNKKPNSVAF
jgi:hypothetical protein